MEFGKIVRRSVFILSIVSTLVSSPIGVPAAQKSPQLQAGSSVSTVQLFRTTVTLSRPTDRARLDKLGIKVLSEGTDMATVLVDDEQLATLARLRFEPHGSDEFNSLINGQATSGLRRPQVTSFAPLMDAAMAVNTEAAAGQLSRADALVSVRAAVNALSPDQTAAISGMTSLDSDGDGLTDTEEQWWCTDPLDANTRGDMQHTDKDYVNRLEQYLWHPELGDHRLGAPFQGWAPSTTNFNRPDRHFACMSSDGSVPDGVKRLLGLNVNSPSTAHDRFNDAIKLFGIDKTGATMPAYVQDPGRHPFVTAYPLPELHIVQSSFVVQAVTTIQTDHTVSNNEQRSYSTAKTVGTSTSVADSVTWNDWEEVSHAVQQPLSVFSPAQQNQLLLKPDLNGLKALAGTAKILAGGAAIVATCGGGLSGALVTAGIAAPVAAGLCVGGIGAGVPTIVDGAANWAEAFTPDQAQQAHPVNNITQVKLDMQNKVVVDNKVNVLLNQNFDTSNIVRAIEGTNYTYAQTGQLMSQRLLGIQYAIAAQRVTDTTSKGHSWGGTQTTTHSEFEQNTVTNGNQFGTSEGWSNATAINTAHAADFWFAYTVRNSGTDYMTSLCTLAFNIFIGDDPNPAYTYFVAPDLGGDGCFHNYQPGDQRTFSAHTQSHAIPLTLEQMKLVDLGAPVNVVVADYSFGVDQPIYAGARSAKDHRILVLVGNFHAVNNCIERLVYKRVAFACNEHSLPPAFKFHQRYIEIYGDDRAVVLSGNWRKRSRSQRM